MQVYDVRVKLLPDNGDHHTLAFCDVVLGTREPQLVLRPFVVLRSDAGDLTVQWPQKADKKQPGNRYLFVEIIDEELASAIEDEVLHAYRQKLHLATLPTAPGREAKWYRCPQPMRAGRTKR